MAFSAILGVEQRSLSIKEGEGVEATHFGPIVQMLPKLIAMGWGIHLSAKLRNSIARLSSSSVTSKLAPAYSCGRFWIPARD